jgi:hypothetical protein
MNTPNEPGRKPPTPKPPESAYSNFSHDFNRRLKPGRNITSSQQEKRRGLHQAEQLNKIRAEYQQQPE